MAHWGMDTRYTSPQRPRVRLVSEERHYRTSIGKVGNEVESLSTPHVMQNIRLAVCSVLAVE